MASKKSTGSYAAARAALCGRTLKARQSCWLIRYKKHTLRLWLPTGYPSVKLVPLVSWLAPTKGIHLNQHRWVNSGERHRVCRLAETASSKAL